jgi:hypothetical protein
MNVLRKMALESARAAAKAVGMDPFEARIAQLILCAQLLTSRSSYTFSLKDNDQRMIAENLAIGLQDKDGFLVARYKLGILPVPVIDGKPAFNAAAPIYWPDPSVFSIAAGTASLSEAQTLESVYSGKLKITTNNDVRLEDYPTSDLRYVSQTQGSGATTNMQTGNEYQELGGLIGFMGFEKNQVELTIECLDKTHIGGDANHLNYLVLTLDGAIVKSATSALFRRA